MKILIILVSCLLLTHSVKILQQKLSYLSQLSQNNPSSLQACTSTQNNIIYAAIASCETFDYSNTTTCITSYISSHTSNQSWSVFIKNSTSNPDTVVFWYTNACYVNLTNYGNYQRTYIIWPAAPTVSSSLPNNQHSIQSNSISQYPNNQIKNMNSQGKSIKYKLNQNGNQTQTQQLEATCLSWKLAAANTAINLCDILGNNNAAQCVVNKIKDILNQYWDAYVSSTNTTGMNYWYYDGCYVNKKSFGTFNRQFITWRAYEG